MKKNLPVIIIGFVLIVGVCVVLYPIVSALLSKMTASVTIANYQKAVENLSDNEIAKMKAAAEQYNAHLSGASLSDPFSGNGEQLDTSYVKMLNINNVMGYLEIPKIKVYLPIFHGSSQEVLAQGIGHLPNTSLPIGGAGTHAVLTGHRGLPSATLLTDLDQMGKGDEFYIHILDEVLAYKVDQIKVVNPDNTSDLRLMPGKDYVTLVTCTPYGINTQRLLVRGERTPYTGMNTWKAPNMVSEVAVVPTAGLLIVAIPIVLFIRWKRRAKK
jgi:sortase A